MAVSERSSLKDVAHCGVPLFWDMVTRSHSQNTHRHTHKSTSANRQGAPVLLTVRIRAGILRIYGLRTHARTGHHRQNSNP